MAIKTKKKARAEKVRVQWKGRGKRDQLATADRMTWFSTDGRYKVEEHKNRPGGLKTAYYALGLFGENFHILGIRTTRVAAEKLCQKDHDTREKTRESERPRVSGDAVQGRQPARRKRSGKN